MFKVLVLQHLFNLNGDIDRRPADQPVWSGPQATLDDWLWKSETI
ncbi:hypothetical protein [Candidatus Vondammii sp. HM_W22]|nr:hypothetical protein [Candidatus Vondammii sp. HM_W22]